MARKQGFKYPRLTFLLIIVICTYFLATTEELPFRLLVLNLGLTGAFIAGFFYVFSFTAIAATAILLILAGDTNFYLTGLIAGVGAVAGDLLIFRTAKVSFSHEFKMLINEPPLKSFLSFIPGFIKYPLKLIIAMLFIALPLPDEVGIVLLANGSKIPQKTFSIISYILNTTGIFFVLYIGKTLL